MRKYVASLLLVVMTVCVLAGCGKSENKASTPTDSASSSVSTAGEKEAEAEIPEELGTVQTMGDILADEAAEHNQSAVYGEDYIYVFQKDDTYYRAIAPMTQETSDAVWDLNFDDEKYDEKLAELISPLEIERIDNLTEMVPPQEELDKLVGKTGEDLLNAGWYSAGFNLADMEFWMEHRPFAYTVTFEGKTDKTADEFDEEEDIKPLVVKSVKYTGLGDATSPGEEGEAAAQDEGE